MWLEQRDYTLPGHGEQIEISRFYNSIIQATGLFGLGWSTKYDETLSVSSDNKAVKLKEPDGKASFFGRGNTGNPFTSFSPKITGQIVQNGDGTYTFTYYDGRVHKFSSAGKLLWQKDRDGNQTTLNYTSGVLTGVTDAYGRTLTITMGSNGSVSQISDSTGTVADYDYYTSTNLLKTVTFQDSSKYKFEYTTISSKTYLTTVKDAYDNVLETHSYNSSGQATTSEKQGGADSYTFLYQQNDPGVGYYTKVTDGLGNITKYYTGRMQGKNIVTRMDGVCGCGSSGSESTKYLYDGSLNLVKKTDAFNKNTVYTYDASRNLTSVTDVLGTQSYTYNSFGEVLNATDRMGGVTTNTYSSTGNLLTTTEPTLQDAVMPVTWTNKVGVTSPNPGTIGKNTYNNAWGDSGGSSNEALLGDGTMHYVSTPTFDSTYDIRMIGLGYVDSNQNYTDIDFGMDFYYGGIYLFENGTNLGRATSFSPGTVIDIERTGTTLKYKVDGVVLRTVTGVSTLPLYVDTSIYSNNFQFTGVTLTNSGTLPAGGTTTVTYSSIGQPASITDARSKTTSLTYDTSGRMTQITDANSKHTNFGYNARAQVTSVTNALSQTTSFDYDSNRRLNKITYPDTHYVTIGYDTAGRRTSVTDELGHATTYAYDGAYRFTNITDALSHATSFGYDAMSNMTSQTDALGNVTNLEYDDFNRLKKVKYPISATGIPRLEENYTYDTLGDVKTKVDTAGHTTTYDYDSAKRLIKITDALSNATQFEYNKRSQMTKVTDALNQHYAFIYDTVGRLKLEARGDGSIMSYGYDATGNRTTRTDRNGNATAYTYDDLSRLTGTSYTGASGENATYTYDDLSRLLTAVNVAGTVTFTYNNRGRLASETDVFGHFMGYSYDYAGNRTALTIDSNAQTGYAYDNANRLTTLTDESSNNFTLAYDVANKLTSRVAPNGVTSTYSYDGMSRLTELKHATTSTTLYDDVFAYNSANQISQIAGLSATKNYTYDNINRLTGMTDGTNTESYIYDAVGNRTASHLSASYTTGSFNRLTATSSASYTYNPNGSMTGKTVGSTTWTYAWDRENRMVSAGDGTNSASYVYDALGRRIKRTQGSNVEKYTHDGGEVVLDDINSTLTKYQNGFGIDNELEFRTGSTSKYLLADHLGSVKLIANSSGSSADSNAYDSFGAATNSSFTSRYQFTGRELDPLTGLQFNRARFYDQTLGRFISEDPIGFYGGFNHYAYVSNRPTYFTDPSGRFPSWGPFDFHGAMTREALRGISTPEQADALARANSEYDARTQGSIYAPYHAMRRPGQSVDDARDEANDFVRYKICLARTYAQMGDESAALGALGAAVHTLQDNESPAHSGFKPAWSDDLLSKLMYYPPHVALETLFPGPSNTAAAEEATRKAWRYYQGEAMPSNFFPNPDDHRYTCGCFQTGRSL